MTKKIGYDLGHKSEETMAMPSKEYKNKVCYPTVYLTDKELPYLEDLEVGDKVSFLCLFKVKNRNEREDEEGKKIDYTLELQKVAEDKEMRITKALEKFMGEHKEVEAEEKGEKEEKE